MTTQLRKKEHYGFTYPEHFDAMFRRRALFIKDGDAYDTEVRWTNADISGANEASKKLKIYMFPDLEGVNRDYEYRDELAKFFPQSHPELKGHGKEWHAVPTSIIPEELLNNYIKHAEVEFNLAVDPIIDWLKEKHAQIFSKYSADNATRAVLLRDLQKEVIDRITYSLMINGVDITIIAELAPRFGKTICFLSLFKTLSEQFDHRVMVIPAYWLSAIASYRKEISSFRDYKEMVFVDTVIDNDWVKTVETALANNKLAVIGVSLYGDYSDFAVRHQWIHDYAGTVLAVPEEADFGSHCERQQEKQAFLWENKKVTKIITSGTNIERMSKGAGTNIADVITVPYSLLEQSGDPTIVRRSMYQMYVSNRVQELVKDYSDTDRPNWKKILEKGMANQDFIKTFFKAIYGYQTEFGMTLDGAAEEEIQVSMVFANITNDAITQLVRLLQNHLPDHLIYPIYGENTSGREAEDDAKDILRQVKHGFVDQSKVIFIANTMGSRSFSVGDIQATVFLTDGGSVDTFAQKNSRCLTPVSTTDPLVVKKKNRGHIFSFSFDPNRERLDQLQILYEARGVMNFFADNGLEMTITEGVQYVLTSMNLKEVGFIGDGRIVNITAEALMKEYEDTEKALRVAGITTDYKAILLDPELMALAFKTAKMKMATEKKVAEIIEKGKTFGGRTPKEFTKDEERIILKELISAMNSIIYSSTTVLAYSNFKGRTYKECLEIINGDPDLDNNFKMLYNLSSSEVMKFLPHLPVELLDISVYNDIKAQHEVCN